MGGFCIRDRNNDYYGVGMWQITHVSDTLNAETISCMKVIEFAAGLRMGWVLIKIDATLLKSARV
jgi:hypothetical protein